MPRTVLTAEFLHETNTFSRVPTGYAAFERKALLFGDEAIARTRQANTHLAGFLDVAEPAGWRVRHVLSTFAEPAGLVTREAFERLGGAIVEAARAAPLDGILLGLHGAMVTEDHEDGEGELLERLRGVVGRALPIGITLDLHANVSRRMTDLADVIVSYKTYPHVDMREAGRQAAAILDRTMAGEIRPTTLRVALPMLDEANGGRTDVGPMIERLERARAYEQEADVFAVSINSGFGNADIAEVGPTVLVTCQGDLERHRTFAESLAADIWALRDGVIARYLSPGEAAAVAKSHAGPRPLVIADWSDNPGGGAYGDAPALLAALLQAGVRDACFGALCDPQAAAALHHHRVGDTIALTIGGRVDPRFGGAPLPVAGVIRCLSEGGYTGDGPMIGGLSFSFGPSAVLEVEGIAVLIVSKPDQMLDLQQFRAFGIDPAAKRVVALKSMQHFRAAFGPIAERVILCDSGALCTPDVTKLPYRRVPRPIWPLDPAMRREDAAWLAP